jgi:hypothetical protein
MEMIIAVTGWRHYTDGAFIRGQLGHWRGPFPLHIRMGDAAGADLAVLKWCQDNKISHHVFYADWERYGKSAGGIRNANMLQGVGDRIMSPTDLLLAFPRTDKMRSKVPGSGTFGAIIEATLMGIRVEIPAYAKSGD